MISQNPIISVIVPVYDVEKFLRKCLNSICNQTMQDIEIICINDCSPDNSLEIIKEYMKEDNRIKLIDFKENKGVAIARNTAIDIAKGKYIGFVDSDDWIDSEFYEKLFLKAEQNDSELVIGNIKTHNVDEITANDFLYKVFKKYKVFYGIFPLGLYKKSLLDRYNIRFIEHRIFGEDRLFPIMANCYAKNFTIVEDCYYNQFSRENSATKNINYKKIEDYIFTSKQVLEFLDGSNIDIQKYIVIARNFWLSSLSFFSETESESKKILKDFILWIARHTRYRDFMDSVDLTIVDNFEKDDITLVQKNIELLNKKELFSMLRLNLGVAKC